MLDLFGGEYDTIENKEESNIYLNAKNNITLTSQVNKDIYTEYISEAFDLHVGDVCTTNIPLNLNIDKNSDWNIGIICGASGSGKSSILKHLAKGNIITPTFDNTKALISNFDNLEPKDATMLLSSMGLASVPTWIRPYNVLSNGEKYRAELAKIVSESNNEIIFIDEYTSVVDRNVAKSMSYALQKYIRRNNKKMIIATCHYDIFEWLQPNWIYDLNKGGVLEQCDYLRQGRPKIELQVFRTTSDTWSWFKKHHYMTHDLNKSCISIVFTWENKLVAFDSILPLPSGTMKNAYREHRLVVLPDFQGMGLGSKISEFIGGILKYQGKTLYTKTVNPSLGEYRNYSHNWQGTAHNNKSRSQKDCERNKKGGVLTRISYCHKYIGEPICGYEQLLRNVDDIRYENKYKGQLTLF